MKKVLALILVFSLLSVSLTAFAKNTVYVKVGGEIMEFQTEPFIENGRTYVPMEDILNSLNAEYTYDAESKTFTIEGDGTTIEGSVDSDTIKVDRYAHTPDVKVKLIGDKVMVPLRFFAEYLNYKVT